ncbi:MAG: class I SAM-dependent methyltransferase [Candidatus Paceibacterota bacterium]
MSTAEPIEEVVFDRYTEAGIRIGEHENADIIVCDDAGWECFLAPGGSVDELILGEGFQKGLWKEGRMSIAEFTKKRTRAKLYGTPETTSAVGQNLENAPIVARVHYDLGNDFFEHILDPEMQYSCGLWSEAQGLGKAHNVAVAQWKKLRLTGTKMRLTPGDLVLDIGCGFGTLLRFLHEEWGIRGIGVTLSEEQARYAREVVKGLPIEIRVCDYRDLSCIDADHIVSVGMFEHVGPAHYKEFFGACHDLLKPSGDLLLHSIFGVLRGGTHSWLERYVFPAGELPVESQMRTASEDFFSIADRHRFDPSNYEKTLFAWNRNMHDAWPTLRESYVDKFFRTQHYYHQLCAALFGIGALCVEQFHMYKGVVPDCYQKVR